MFIELTSTANNRKFFIRKSSIQVVSMHEEITSIYTDPTSDGIGVKESYEYVKQLLGEINGN